MELWTIRKYPCGCQAQGAGDVPAYCHEHGTPPPEYGLLNTMALAMEPFVKVMEESSGRIPSERLSGADWHGLWRAYISFRTAQVKPINPYDAPVQTNLSQGAFDDLVRDAMKWRTSGLAANKPGGSVSGIGAIAENANEISAAHQALFDQAHGFMEPPE